MGVAYERGQVAYSLGRWADAAREFERELGEDPQNADAAAALAACLLHENYHEAVAAAEAALAMAPDHPYAHYVRAVALHGCTRTDCARGAIGESLRIEPAQPDCLALLAEIEWDSHNFAAALAAAESGLEHDPQNRSCQFWRARSLLSLGRVDAAEDAIQVVLRSDPDSFAIHALRGWLEIARGRKPQAGEHFREALRLNPLSTDAELGLNVSQYVEEPATPIRNWLIVIAIGLLIVGVGAGMVMAHQGGFKPMGPTTAVGVGLFLLVRRWMRGANSVH